MEKPGAMLSMMPGSCRFAAGEFCGDSVYFNSRAWRKA